KLRSAREEVGRPVLHRAEQAAVRVIVHGAPRSPLRLRLLDPPAFVRRLARAGLPPDAAVTHLRRRLQRDAGEARDARAAHDGGPISSTTTSTVGRPLTSEMRTPRRSGR